MTKEMRKKIVVPIDGSDNAKRSLAYLDLMFGPDHPLDITVLYILPTLPPILVEERNRNPKAARQLEAVEARNVEVAEKYLAEAKKSLVDLGFKDEAVTTIHRQKDVGTARDICKFSNSNQVDAVMVSTKGRSRMQAFFMGEVSRNLLEHCPKNPIWLMEPVVKKKNVLVAVDSSENALRAVDHAGFMLSGTDKSVILFHTKRHLGRFLPSEVLGDAPDLEELWKDAAGEQITPYLKKAHEMLLAAGLKGEQISTKIVDGSRSAADDILKAAKEYDCGTIVCGRRGLSGVKEFIMGSVTRKILEDLSETAVWIAR